jgi:hypothetical protein
VLVKNYVALKASVFVIGCYFLLIQLNALAYKAFELIKAVISFKTYAPIKHIGFVMYKSRSKLVCLFTPVKATDNNQDTSLL